MKKMIFLILAQTLVSISFASAGGVDGGGGIGVACNTRSGTHLELLDLYESQNIYHNELTDKESSLQQEVLKSFTRLLSLDDNPYTQPYTPDQNFVNHVLTTFNSMIDFIPQNSNLPFTNDATLPILKPGCQFVQIAIYKSNQRIQLNKSLWDLLDNKNKAALILHESIYYGQRNIGDLDSDVTRKFVGRVFSKKQLLPKYFDMPAANVVFCNTQGFAGRDLSAFYAYPSQFEKGYVLSFSQITKSATILWRATGNIGPINLFESTGTNFSVTGNVLSEFESRYQFRLFRSNPNSQIMLSIYNTKTKEMVTSSVKCRSL
jgi:hypothetical protein